MNIFGKKFIMGYLEIKRFHLLISFGVAFFCLFFLLFQGKKDIIGTIVFCGFKKKNEKNTKSQKLKIFFFRNITKLEIFWRKSGKRWVLFFASLSVSPIFKKSYVAKWSSVRLAICRAEFESRSLWKGHRVLITHTERVFWENFNGTAQNWNSEKK